MRSARDFHDAQGHLGIERRVILTQVLPFEELGFSAEGCSDLFLGLFLGQTSVGLEFRGIRIAIDEAIFAH